MKKLLNVNSYLKKMAHDLKFKVWGNESWWLIGLGSSKGLGTKWPSPRVIDDSLIRVSNPHPRAQGDPHPKS